MQLFFQKYDLQNIQHQAMRIDLLNYAFFFVFFKNKYLHCIL